VLDDGGHSVEAMDLVAIAIAVLTFAVLLGSIELIDRV
jgi:hypothetical protein